MRFLIDASLPRSAADLARRHGHDALDVRDCGMGTAPDPVIARHAKEHGYVLLTGDFDFGDVRAYPPTEYPGIVVIDRPENGTIATVLSLIERLFVEWNVLAHVAGRLVIVDVRRIRVRPAIDDPI